MSRERFLLSPVRSDFVLHVQCDLFVHDFLVFLVPLVEEIEYIDLLDAQVKFVVFELRKFAFQLAVHFLSSLFAPLEKQIDVFIRNVVGAGLEDFAGSVVSHFAKILLVEKLTLFIDPALLNHKVVPSQFDLLSFNDFLLDRVLACHAVHHHWVDLSYSVCSIHGLHVHLRIEVTIIDDNGVGRCKVDPQSARPRREQENKISGVWRCEVIDLLVSELHFSVSVDSAVGVLP